MIWRKNPLFLPPFPKIVRALSSYNFALEKETVLFEF